MKLIVKFNAVLLIVGALGFAATAVISHRLLQNKARAETLHNARLLLEAASASRAYTDTNIVKLLAAQMKDTFLPESMPSFAAAEIFGALHESMPSYYYKDAALNPINPRNRAVDWEADIVNQFRQDPTQKELSGERDTPTGRSLYLARPITIKDDHCLGCHDSAATAPKTLVERYGSVNGFGWKLNETVAAQIVSVPAQVPFDNAHATYVAFMTSLAVVFSVLFIVLNLLLTFFVIRPVTHLSAIAERVSLGDSQAPDFVTSSRDEIGCLASAFRRMRTSLQKAIELIEP